MRNDDDVELREKLTYSSHINDYSEVRVAIKAPSNPFSNTMGVCVCVCECVYIYIYIYIYSNSVIMLCTGMRILCCLTEEYNMVHGEELIGTTEYLTL